MYEAYVGISEYEQTGGEIPADEQKAALTLASHHVDTLTYNRILAIGWDNLTDFQKEIIRDVVCRQADFEYENSDMIRSVLSGYSLNGASVQFGSSWNVVTRNGIAMQRDVYAMLCQTGLCCRSLGVM